MSSIAESKLTSLDTSYQRRAYEVERAIDPKYSPPGVVIVRDTSEKPAEVEIIPALKHLILFGGNVVGFCNVKTNYYTEERWFNGIRLDDDYRNQGLGIATYKEAIVAAIMQGLSFRTDEMLKASAKERWEKLAAIGVARAIREFEPAGPDWFRGYYKVEATPSKEMSSDPIIGGAN